MNINNDKKIVKVQYFFLSMRILQFNKTEIAIKIRFDMQLSDIIVRMTVA